MSVVLDYKTFGEKNLPTLVVVHGLFGLLDNWQTVAKNLSDTYHIHLLTLRNHGRSPWTDEMSYDLMAKDIVDHCTRHELTHIYILGHSMGGKVCMNLCMQYPDLVQKLIVADIAPKSYPPHHQHILEACEQMESMKLTERKEAETIFKNSGIDTGVIQFMLKNLRRREDKTLGMKFNRKVLQEQMHHLMAAPEAKHSTNIPTCFVRGGNSDYILDEDIPDIKHRYTKARIMTLKDTGHWLHAEKPKEFTQLVRFFLA